MRALLRGCPLLCGMTRRHPFISVGHEWDIICSLSFGSEAGRSARVGRGDGKFTSCAFGQREPDLPRGTSPYVFYCT